VDRRVWMAVTGKSGGFEPVAVGDGYGTVVDWPRVG